MKVLGICHDIHITSAALIDNGVIVAGAAEERFVRQKATMAFPTQAVAYCLREAKLKMEDIDYVALGWNPGMHIKRRNGRWSGAARWRAEYLYSVPNQLIPFLKQDPRPRPITQTIEHSKGALKIVYVTHHLAHAANGFYLSPFKEAAILTVDGRGEDDTALFARGRGNKIEELGAISFPHSLGLLYGTFTQFLGFQPDHDEWKVMALASYGSRNNGYYKKLKSLVRLTPDGRLELDLSYFSYYLHDQFHFYTPKFVNLFGKPRLVDGPLTSRHYEIASALQQMTEEILVHALNWLHRKTRSVNLVVNGGVFMNSVFNGKIKELTPFKQVFISSCPDDSGTSIGAALYTYHHLLGGSGRQEQKHNYYGPEFSDAEIREALKKYQLQAESVSEVEDCAARLLANGKIVGWFQGRMEFGQRALGNRSILADPRRPEMKDRVNLAVKYRESFRPFAPSVLEETVEEYFECEAGATVPFMEKVFQIKKDKQKVIPAVTHVDGSGRLQTVNRQTNPRYYKLIRSFQKLTGVPVVLNTSFNLKGEPIVCTPTDAIRTFYSSGLDALILGNYVLEK